MIVTTTLASNVLGVAAGGAGSALPVVGMSPAKIEVDSTHVSASTVANRFMGVAPLRLRKCQQIYIKFNGTLREDFLQGGPERTTIRLHSLNFSLLDSLKSHADYLSEARYVSPYCKRRS